MSDTQDVEALVARLEAVTEADAYAQPWTFGETCREAATALRTATLLIGKAESRASSLEAQLAGAKEALGKAEQRFETIRETLVNHLQEPERSAFWTAVSGRDDIRRARAVYEALASAPASAPVVSHERPSGETQAGLLLTDETQAFGGPPAGYHPLPDGMRCRCIRLWQDGKGNHWCCKPTSALAASRLTPSEGRDGKEVRS